MYHDCPLQSPLRTKYPESGYLALLPLWEEDCDRDNDRGLNSRYKPKHRRRKT